MKLTDRVNFREHYLNPALDAGFIEMTLILPRFFGVEGEGIYAHNVTHFVIGISLEIFVISLHRTPPQRKFYSPLRLWQIRAIPG